MTSSLYRRTDLDKFYFQNLELSDTEEALPTQVDEADDFKRSLFEEWGNASIEARALITFYTTGYDLQREADPSLAILSQQPDNAKTGPREPLSDLDKYAYNVNQGAGTTIYIIDKPMTKLSGLLEVSTSRCSNEKCR